MLKRLKCFFGGILLLLQILLTVPAMAAPTWQQTGGPEGGQIQALAIDPSNSQTIYAGALLGGVFKSTNGGVSWNAVNSGLKNVVEYVFSLVIDPSNSQTIYAGTNMGVYKSTNGGDSWNAINNGMPNPFINIFSFFLAIDPTNPQTIYAVTSSGVYKSINGGDSWSAANNGLSSTWVNSLVIDPTNSQTIYAGTYGGVYKSTNGGDSWSAANGGLGGSSDVYSLVIDPTNSQTIYAGALRGGVFKSTNGGVSWNAINSGLTGSVVGIMAIDPTNSQTIFAGTDSGLFKSTNGGGSWSAVNTGLGGTSAVYSLVIDPTNSQTIYVGTFGGVFRSIDGSDSWNSTNSGLTGSVVRIMAIDPTNSQTIYAGTDSGLYKSANSGDSWSAANNGLSDMSVRSLAIDPTNSQTIYAGIHAGIPVGGAFKSTNGGALWNADSNGLDKFGYTGLISLAIDPTNSQTIYAGTMTLGVYKSTNGGDSWGDFNSGLTGDGMQVPCVVIDPTTSQTIYAGTNGGVFKSTNGGGSWSAANNGPSGILSLAIDPTNTKTIYAGTWVGVYKSTNGGDSWSTANNGLTYGRVTSLVIDPSNPQIIYAGIGNGGVFRSNNGADSWSAANSGLTDLNILSLTIDPTTRTLYAGTAYGGVFKLAEPPPPASAVTITPNMATPRTTGTSVTFTAAGLGGSGRYQYEFYVQSLTGVWTKKQAYATANTFTWNTAGLVAGNYQVAVWAKSAGSSPTTGYDTYAIVNYSLTAPPPASGVTITPDTSSPQLTGTTVTFTAAGIGGTGSYEYQFYTYDSKTGWTMRKIYSTSNAFTWNTAGLAAGNYQIAVWAKSAGSSPTTGYDTYAIVNYSLAAPPPASGATITPDKTSPQFTGTSVTFTAAGIGGTGSYEYQFYSYDSSTGWTMRKVYSTSNTFTWNTAGLAAGNYQIAVWAKSAGSSPTTGYDTYAIANYSIAAPPPVSGATIIPDKVSPQFTGTTVTFTAAGIGGTGSYEYQFYTLSPGGSWTMRQAYSSTNTFVWDTTGFAAGEYQLKVWAKSAGTSPATGYDTYATTNYSLTVPPPLISAPARVDMVHDASRDIIYITNGDSVLRYHIGSKSFLSPFTLGGNLYGIDLSPDGNTLVIADRQHSQSEVWIHLVDLRTGLPRKANFPKTFGEGGTFTAVFGKDGASLVSSIYDINEGTGSVPLRRYDPATGVTTLIAPVISQGIMLTSSSDGSIIGFAEGDSSDGPFGRYRIVDGNFLRKWGYTDGTSHYNYEIGINHNGTQFAIPTYYGTFIYDADLKKINSIGQYAGPQPIGVVYHPVEDIVYFAWSGSSEIRSFDTNSYIQLAAYNFADTFTNPGYAFIQGRLKISSDGSLLMATVSGGVRYLRLYDPLAANEQNVVTDENKPVAITLKGTVGNGGSLSYAIETNPVHGTLSGTAPNLIYTPNTNFYGTDSFIFKVSYGAASVSAKITITVNLTPVSGVTITPDKVSPQVTGTTITFTAAGSGGTGSYEYLFYTYDSKTGWTMRQAYSTATTFTWNTSGLAPGDYQVAAWVKSAGSSPAAGYDTYTIANYPLTVPPPATGVTLVPDKASSQPIGTTITFTANGSGGTGSYEYQFYSRSPGGSWIMRRAYSTDNVIVCDTTDYPAGDYQGAVWVKNAGTNPAKGYDTYTIVDYTLTAPPPATGATLTPDKASPQLAGTTVTFTAAGSGGTGSYEYQYYTLAPGGTWAIRKGYSTSNTFTWNTSGLAPGNYQIAAWVKSAGTSPTKGYDTYATVNYSLTVPPPATGATITPDKTSPQTTGTTITFTAAGSGGSGSYEYEYYVQSPSGVWEKKQAYSTGNTFAWNTSGLAAGNYQFAVWAKSAGSSPTKGYDIYALAGYTLAAPPVNTGAGAIVINGAGLINGVIVLN